MGWVEHLPWIICVGAFVVLPEITGTVVNLAKINAEREIRVTEAKNPVKDAPEEESVGFRA